MIVVLDVNQVVTLINKKGSKILGLDQKDVVGKNWIDNFIPKNERIKVKEIFNTVFSNKEMSKESSYNHIITALNNKRLIKWSNAFLYDENNHVTGIISSGEDVTEISLANERLKISEARFRNLFEKAPFVYQSLDETGHFIEVNKKWLTLLGYEKEEIIGKWFGDFLHPDYKEAFKKRFEIFKKEGSIYSEFLMQTKSGQIIQVGFDGNIGYHANHKFKQTLCTLTDITEISMANN